MQGAGVARGELTCTRWEMAKEMSADAPRRIVRLTTQNWLPFTQAKDPQGLLERASLNGPVYQSLNPVIENPLQLHWQE